ncbi:hypothetical protein LXL04_025157 [Taraxacum kok-saghyz]
MILLKREPSLVCFFFARNSARNPSTAVLLPPRCFQEPTCTVTPGDSSSLQPPALSSSPIVLQVRPLALICSECRLLNVCLILFPFLLATSSPGILLQAVSFGNLLHRRRSTQRSSFSVSDVVALWLLLTFHSSFQQCIWCNATHKCRAACIQDSDKTLFEAALQDIAMQKIFQDIAMQRVILDQSEARAASGSHEENSDIFAGRHDPNAIKTIVLKWQSPETTAPSALPPGWWLHLELQPPASHYMFLFMWLAEIAPQNMTGALGSINQELIQCIILIPAESA